MITEILDDLKSKLGYDLKISLEITEISGILKLKYRSQYLGFIQVQGSNYQSSTSILKELKNKFIGSDLETQIKTILSEYPHSHNN